MSQLASSHVRLIVGGASKSGTTALYYYLKQHPEICVPRRKELHYFAREQLAARTGGPGDGNVLAELPRSLAAYLEFFSHCQAGQIGADISPSYLFHRQSAKAIVECVTDPRLVFILRNPADKAFSQYVHQLAAGRETLSFEHALEEERNRRRLGYGDMWLYRESGFYSESLHEFVRVFGPERVRIYYFEEFLSNPSALLSDICKFCGIADGFSFALVADANPTGTPRSRLLAQLIAPNALSSRLKNVLPPEFAQRLKRWVKVANLAGKPRLNPKLRHELLQGYRSDIEGVQQIVGRATRWI